MKQLRRLCFLLVGLVLFSSLVFASEPCTVPHSSEPLDDAFGVNIDFTDPRPGEMKMLAAAGFRWVRMDLKWDATETESGRYDFAAYDRLMSSLAKENVRAVFILDYGNPLYDEGAPPRTEKTRKAFVRWAVAAAKHFSNRGVLWEIYNEPNHELFWPPSPNVSDYVALAMAVGRAFRENVPNEKLIGPATAGVDFEFLEACFKRGLLHYLSAVSVHPYRREDPETATTDYCRLRRLIDRYANEKKQIPIISGEWGYSTSWPGISVRKQSELLVRSFLTNASNGVRLSVWYDWRDDGSDVRNDEHNFGTVANEYRQHSTRPYDPKPAYVAAVNLTGFLAGYRFVKRIHVGSDDDLILVFQKDTDTRVAAWTTAKREREVFVPLGAGLYSITEYSGKSVGNFRSTQGGLNVKLSNAPFYIKKIH